MNSIPTLMQTTAEFLVEKHNDLPVIKNSLTFMTIKESINGCHFWSNFEIASFEFYQSKLYEDYMETLEKAGGFYYERWGDAPVHSVAASFLLEQSRNTFL